MIFDELIITKRKYEKIKKIYDEKVRILKEKSSLWEKPNEKTKCTICNKKKIVLILFFMEENFDNIDLRNNDNLFYLKKPLMSFHQESHITYRINPGYIYSLNEDFSKHLTKEIWIDQVNKNKTELSFKDWLQNTKKKEPKKQLEVINSFKDNMVKKLNCLELFKDEFVMILNRKYIEDFSLEKYFFQDYELDGIT